jgi:hypothetical protein
MRFNSKQRQIAALAILITVILVVIFMALREGKCPTKSAKKIRPQCKYSRHLSEAYAIRNTRVKQWEVHSDINLDLLYDISPYVRGATGRTGLAKQLQSRTDSPNNSNLPKIKSSTAAPLPITKSQSKNWAGYISANSLIDPSPNSCSFVTGTFNIPSLSRGVSTYNNNVSIWVGMDGAFNSNPTIQQIGIDLQYVNSKTIIYAWFQMYPNPPYKINNFPANVGDVISVSVKVASTEGSTTTYELTIANVTQHESITIPTSQTISNNSMQQCVEWIVEAPSIGDTISPLSEFSPVTWTNCYAKIGGASGGIGTFPGKQLAMVDFENSLKAETSDLTPRGNAFAVTWKSQ